MGVSNVIAVIFDTDIFFSNGDGMTVIHKIGMGIIFICPIVPITKRNL